MYEYEFVRIDFHGLLKPTPKEDYQEIIRERGKNGWRLVQIFAPATFGHYGAPAPDHYELIFEREVS